MKSKIKSNLLIGFTVLIGMIALSSFYFFYNKQKEFSKNQKEFILALNRIEINEATLELALLQNYIYSYNNNDDIERPLLALEKSFETLKQTKILSKKQYRVLEDNIFVLQDSIKKIFNDTQHFIMLNAAIKNSLLFLVGYDHRFNHSDNKSLLFIKSGRIIESLLYTKWISDTNFLNQNLYLDENLAKTPKEKEFVRVFNEHIHFLIKTFPLFFEVSQEIRSNNIPYLVEEIKKSFSKIAINDTKLLNNFTYFLLGGFIVTYLYLIIILLKYKKEHKQLVIITKKQKQLLHHDQLTKIKNRYAYTQDLATLKSPSVIVVSINQFKDINDVYGMDIGDKLLVVFVEYLQQIAKRYHGLYNIYRVGGDEFCLLFEYAQTDELENIAKRLQKQIDTKEFLINAIEMHINASFAISDKQPLLENADLALKYFKKLTGTNIAVYNESLQLQESTLENIQMVRKIKKAIKDDNVIIHFQPIINLKNDTIEKYEVLVRLRDKDTIIPPYAFLELSKTSNLYHEITKIVIEKTIQTAKIYPSYRFSINLAMSDISNEVLVRELFHIFDRTPEVASRIDIELLEVEGLSDLKMVKEFIDKLHKYGSKVLIDDFGSGYSNFYYFAELDIDIVKIDGSIIHEIVSNQRKFHMLESIVKFCRGMGLKMVAEFVDSQEIVMVLKNLNIEYAQGYYFSKPLEQPLLRKELHG